MDNNWGIYDMWDKKNCFETGSSDEDSPSVSSPVGASSGHATEPIDIEPLDMTSLSANSSHGYDFSAEDITRSDYFSQPATGSSGQGGFFIPSGTPFDFSFDSASSRMGSFPDPLLGSTSSYFGSLSQRLMREDGGHQWATSYGSMSDSPFGSSQRSISGRATANCYGLRNSFPSVFSLVEEEEKVKNKTKICNFCMRNGEEFFNHRLKDRQGRVLCPVLSSFKCKLCGATGQLAHTWKYCPRNPITMGRPQMTGLPPGVPLEKLFASALQLNRSF